MSNIVPFQPGQVSSLFAAQPIANDLAAGVQASFGLIRYKGKVWKISYRGEERVLMRDDGDGPRNSIEVVILKAGTHLSKIWYEQGYEEGSSQSPDCFSMNGVTPELTSKKRQSDVCASCPRNAWGSKVTPAGKAGKECQDSKRVAVVPTGDLRNEAFGGPMLLRVPAASLQALAQYGQVMGKMGYHYYAVSTKISFDSNEAYPKFLFEGVRALSDEEARIIIEWQNDPLVERIIAESEYDIAPAAQAQGQVLNQPQSQVFTQPTGGAQSSPAQGPMAQPGTSSSPTQAAPAQTPTQTPAPTGFGPTTGAAPSQNAPAAQSASNPVSTQPQQASTPSPATAPTTTASPGGSATNATPGGQTSGGFGPMAPSDQSGSGSAQTQQGERFQGEPTKADVPAFLGGSSGTTTQPETAPSDFEKSLEEKLNGLLAS